MQSKTLGLLAVLALGAAGAAVVVHTSRSGTSSELQAGNKLFPSLDPNKVQGVRVQKGGTTLNLGRKDGTWVLEERGGYPADFGKVKQFVLQFAELELLEQKTSNPELYAKLDLQEPGTEGANSSLVVLEDAMGGPLAALIVGKPNYQAGEALYVRRQGETTSWLAKGKLNVPDGLNGWVVKEILKLERERVRSVKLFHPGGETLSIVRQEQAQLDFSVENIPPGRELSSPSIASTIGSALSFVSLEDVAPRADVDFAASPGVRAEFRTFDGLLVEVVTTEREAKHWVAFSVRFEAPPAEATVPAPPAEGELPAPAPESGLKSPEEVQREVAALQSKLEAWAFQLPDYRVESLKKQMSDLLKPLPTDFGAPSSLLPLEQDQPTQGTPESQAESDPSPAAQEADGSGLPPVQDLDAPALDPINPPK